MSRDPFPRPADESLHLIANALADRVDEGATRPPVGWAVLELLGHRREVGYLSEQEIAGRTFLRLSTPVWNEAAEGWASESGARVHLFSTAAVYAITPTTERAARDEIAPWIDCDELVSTTQYPDGAKCAMRRGHDGDHDPDGGLPF